MIPPLDVVRVLNKAKIKFTLVGAHALGNWTHRPRTTDDVDVVVAARHVKLAVAALTRAFNDLIPENAPLVVRLRRGKNGPVVVDILKPKLPTVKAALSSTRIVKCGQVAFSIPTLELSLVMKFGSIASMLSGYCEKYLDAADFVAMAKAHSKINTKRLTRLGDLYFVGGGRAVVKMLIDARVGRQIVF